MCGGLFYERRHNEKVTTISLTFLLNLVRKVMTFPERYCWLTTVFRKLLISFLFSSISYLIQKVNNTLKFHRVWDTKYFLWKPTQNIELARSSSLFFNCSFTASSTPIETQIKEEEEEEEEEEEVTQKLIRFFLLPNFNGGFFFPEKLLRRHFTHDLLSHSLLKEI